MTRDTPMELAADTFDKSEHEILLDMADRLEAEMRDGLPQMEPREKRCPTCPFRGASKEYVRSAAFVPAHDWSCHTDCLHGGPIQCRGHYNATRKHGAKMPDDIRAEAAAIRARAESQPSTDTTMEGEK